VDGQVVYAAVARAHGLPYAELAALLAG